MQNVSRIGRAEPSGGEQKHEIVSRKKERKKKNALKKKKKKTIDKKTYIFFLSFRTKHMASKESQSRWYSRKRGNNASGSSQVHYLSLLR